jgi:hypothetical protein
MYRTASLARRLYRELQSLHVLFLSLHHICVHIPSIWTSWNGVSLFVNCFQLRHLSPFPRRATWQPSCNFRRQLFVQWYQNKGLIMRVFISLQKWKKFLVWECRCCWFFKSGMYRLPDLEAIRQCQLTKILLLRYRSWLKHYATSWKVAGSSPRWGRFFQFI